MQNATVTDDPKGISPLLYCSPCVNSATAYIGRLRKSGGQKIDLISLYY